MTVFLTAFTLQGSECELGHLASKMAVTVKMATVEASWILLTC